MVSPKQLLSTIESTLLTSSSPSPSERIELMHAIRSSISSLQNLLSFPPPRPADRTEVQSKEVRFPNSPPMTLDDQDVQLALKLSDDLHLNEIECVRLLVSTNQEWGLLGREPLEILRLATGLWYTERRDLITALYTLLRAVVLDQDVEGDIVADIQKYMEDLIKAGLRQRLIKLIKELNWQEPGGSGGPNAERFIIDARGAIVERQAVVSRERLILSHCLVLSVLVVRTTPKDIKDIFSILKDEAAELNDCRDTSKYQITYGILYSLVIAFTSDALSTAPEKLSLLSHDASFRQEFQEIVMSPVNDPNVSGFVDCVRLAWSVHLMLVQEGTEVRDTVSSASSKDFQNISSCLDVIFSNNVFEFFLHKVLRTAAYKNDDEDMTYMYNAYLHKLVTIFLSEPLAREKVKEVKEKVMAMLSPYRMGGPHVFPHTDDINADHSAEVERQPFISLLEFISEIYQKEPELLSGNDVVWTFVNFAGEDHNNFHTLVAFLKMLGALACSQEGASKVFELLQGKTFRSVSWSTLFDCLSIYADKFKQTLQSTGSLLPDFPEGDAKALVAYLTVLRKVVENGNPIDRKNWFLDIEPLFKLLSYENVPPFLKGALRDAIAVFIQVSPLMKGSIWAYLEQYDLPVVVGPQVGNTTQPISTQVYDMQFELNEIEARTEHYPSTISFINLLNALIAEERDFSDRGRRFVGIFRFIYDQVFGPFSQRAYGDLCEKWQLVVACLHHFRMILSTYEINAEDIESVVDGSQLSTAQQPAQLQLQLPAVELMKDFMSGKTVFRNIMSILSPGVNSIISERTSQLYGNLLEKAVHLSLEIIILVLEKDLQLADFWRPLYQPLDVILSQDHNQIVALLEYVRYDLQPHIQQYSIKIMSALSSRMVGLVQLLLQSHAASSLVEDYASCLEIRSQENQNMDNSSDDLGVLILQLLIENIRRPAPNITHLLLKFDLDTPIERTVLQPRFNYSCLKVILDILDKLLKPDTNALLHEFGFQLLYELCVDELTSGPVMDLLCSKRYNFFVKHLETVGVVLLPKRNSSQALRTSSLHQRAWLLKLLTVELHSGDIKNSSHRETCHKILAYLFGQDTNGLEGDQDITSSLSLQNRESAGTRTINKSKALELLDIIQFRPPEVTRDYSQIVSNTKFSLLAEEILRSSASEKDGIYYYSERGDRLINLTAFRDKLWQLCSFDNELELNNLREMVQQLLRWAWKYNRNLEEQAAQLHMLTSWSQIVEISASRRLSSLENRTEVLLQLLDASLSASASVDCSLKMALLLTQVALTCMAKLRDDRYLYPAGFSSDALTCLGVLMFKQLSNGACLSILFKLTLALLRHDSSEALRRRQYALLLSYFQYCQHVLDPDVPRRILQLLLGTEQDSEDMDLEKIDKEQAELARSNFSILRKEGQAILDLVIKDATQGSESGKTMSHFVLDALVCIDHEKFFLNQLQSRGFLRSCLMSISNFSQQDVRRPMEVLQRACTLEAELALMLRISHKYGKAGAQVLSSMGILEHLATCKALHIPLKGSLRQLETRFGREIPANADKQQVVVAPVLRLVFSLTSLVDASDFFEVKNKIVREAMEFVKAHPSLFDRALLENISEADELMMELINLVVGILSKVWPYEENDEYGFVQSLFRMMCDLFSQDTESFSSVSSGLSPLNRRRLELRKFHIGFKLCSYLYFQVTKKSVRLQVSDRQKAYHKSGGKLQPTLALLVHFLNTVTSSLERAADEKSLLLNKIQDVNELSRQEVDGIISTFTEKTRVSSSDNTNTRRYIAMVEMCQIVGDRDQLVTLLLLLAEHVLNVILTHFQDTSFMAETNGNRMLITYTSDKESEQELSSLCGKLLPILERLELLNEDKIGQNLKVFFRLVTSLKDLTVRKLAL
ncbi:nuclear pore complex protein NUP205 isoform X1 [Amaranthus tricolor]|uniref:nuclear pore complex protein NUP205 isoform X1 n=1 Tax=Amaranthus tricolor TaxID=29722 RepID=UPI00258B437E|nr:nuclear pore complex protein NUP205 isoform X1 [Amaranthus tricolor]